MQDHRLALVESLLLKGTAHCAAHSRVKNAAVLLLTVGLGFALFSKLEAFPHDLGGLQLARVGPHIALAASAWYQMRAHTTLSSGNVRPTSLISAQSVPHLRLRNTRGSSEIFFSPSTQSLDKQRHVHARAATAVAEKIDTSDMAKIFGRLAEKVIYQDPAVGDCCHSACSDCEWRLPDGGYRFDIQRAVRPKWIPCYTFRDFEDHRGSHKPLWASIFAAGPLSKDDFSNALLKLKFNMPLGPSGFLSGQPKPSEQALDRFWEILTGTLAQLKGVDPATIVTLTSEDFIAVLQKWSTQADADPARGGPDFASWNDFEAAMCSWVLPTMDE